MNPPHGLGNGRAAALRREFDQLFAQPERVAPAETEDLLALRIGGEAYALELSAIAGLHLAPPVVPLPGAVPELLGLSGLRGRLIGVYDLALLLGIEKCERPRWVALPAGARTVGLAFAELSGLLRVTPGELAGAPPPGGAPAAPRVVRPGGVVHSVVDAAAVVETIRRLARRRGPAEER